MANTCCTIYKITGIDGNNDAYNQLKEYLDKNWKELWLGDMAKFYGVDFEELGISARGWVCYYEEDKGVITLDVDSAWAPNEQLFEEINNKLDNQLSISWKAEEPGCEIFWIHDEGGYFPENYYVDCSGFDNCECDYFETLEEVVDYWCKLTGEKRDGRTDEEMLKVIEDWEYEDEDTFFIVHEFDRD